MSTRETKDRQWRRHPLCHDILGVRELRRSPQDLPIQVSRSMFESLRCSINAYTDTSIDTVDQNREPESTDQQRRIPKWRTRGWFGQRDSIRRIFWQSAKHNQSIAGIGCWRTRQYKLLRWSGAGSQWYWHRWLLERRFARMQALDTS